MIFENNQIFIFKINESMTAQSYLFVCNNVDLENMQMQNNQYCLSEIKYFFQIFDLVLREKAY